MWFLPTDDEWFKAAYHKNEGLSGDYWEYPTRGDLAPTASSPPGDTNSSNYGSAFNYPGSVGTVTDVGAYSQSVSSYGTFDQGGERLGIQ